jgi:hypothetical protein
MNDFSIKGRIFRFIFDESEAVILRVQLLHLENFELQIWRENFYTSVT